MLVSKRKTNQENYDVLFKVLVGAYENDTLRIGNSCGCAVGNLVTAACGMTHVNNPFMGLMWEEGTPKWGHKFCTILERFPPRDGRVVVRSDEHHMQILNVSLPPDQEDDANYELRQIGLPLHHLLNIEWLFETNAANGKDEDERMYLGLLAVLDYLAEIFEVEQEKKNNRTKLAEVFELV